MAKKKKNDAAPEAPAANEVRIAESRELLKQPIPAGLKVFEAPDGFVVLAEAKAPYVLYTPTGGKEIRIHPRR